MSSGLTRRAFVRGLIAGTASTAILGFDPVARSWVTRAQPTPPPFDQVPPLEGRLRLDDETRSAFSRDFGRVLYHEPVAVLEPGSVSDVAQTVRFANRHRLRVGMRGQGFSMLGQSQVEGGIVIDSSAIGFDPHRRDHGSAGGRG